MTDARIIELVESLYKLNQLDYILNQRTLPTMIEKYLFIQYFKFSVSSDRKL